MKGTPGIYFVKLFGAFSSIQADEYNFLLMQESNVQERVSKFTQLITKKSAPREKSYKTVLVSQTVS